ncbi:MAG: peroxiredoxin family protein [Candidatus Cryptobacteroides sp.]
MLISLAFVCSCIQDTETGYEGRLHPGDELPYFELKMSDGRILDTPGLKGFHSVIIFFNTACPDCAQLLPSIQRVYDLHASSPAVLLLVSREEGEESVSEFWKKNGLTMPYAACEDRSVYSLFADAGIPRVYCSDAELTIVAEAQEKGCLQAIRDFLVD